MKGFFAASEVRTKEYSLGIAQCGACGLYKTCKSPKMPVSGHGEKGILLVGEAPGANEDDQGMQFVGESGKLLQKTLRKVGIDMREDCWVTNALICRPPKNETPTSKQIDYCRPNLVNTIKELKPKVIIPCGGAAIESLLKAYWKDEVGSIGKWAGFQIPHQKLNAWICPTYHPSFLLYNDGNDSVFGLASVMFEKHLEAAVAKRKRPWKNVPDYESTVERIMDDGKAAKEIRSILRGASMVAFDYETNMLKPDSEAAKIICCSICADGERTISYPWYGEAIDATQELLISRIPKIASNLKFEDRWTRRVFGHGVRAWKWDTMIGAHWLDNRPGITGIKFQAFVMLGVTAYDEHIKPYMKAKTTSTPNKLLDEVNLDQLLLYCGMDSLLEYKVAIKQMQKGKYAY